MEGQPEEAGGCLLAGDAAPAREGLTPDDAKQTWTFSSSGWLFVYFFGVVKAMRETNSDRNLYVIGSSGGACAGGLLFCPEIDPEAMVRYICECCRDCRSSLNGIFRIRQYVRGAIERFCPEDIGERLTGHMEVSVTRLLTLSNIRWSEFDSKEDYVDAILSSSCAVVFAGLPYPSRRYGYLIDGGFSDLELLKAVCLGTKFCSFHNGDVTSVCPFYCSRADIRPSKYVPIYWAVFPPEPQKLYDLYELGYRDALFYLHCAQAGRRVLRPIQVRSHQVCVSPSNSEGSLSQPTLSPSSGRRRAAAHARLRSHACAPSPPFSDASFHKGAYPAEAGTAVLGVPAVRGGLGGGGDADDWRAGQSPWGGSDGSDAWSGAADVGQVPMRLAMLEDSVQGVQQLARASIQGALEPQQPQSKLWRFARALVCALAWQLVYVDVLLQIHICSLVMWISPLLPRMHVKRTWTRAWFCITGACNLRFLLKTLPLLGHSVMMHGNTDFEMELENVSFMYRLLYFLL